MANEECSGWRASHLSWCVLPPFAGELRPSGVPCTLQPMPLSIKGKFCNPGGRLDCRHGGRAAAIRVGLLLCLGGQHVTAAKALAVRKAQT